MAGLFGQYKTDNVKEVEGIEIQFPEAENDDGTIPTFIISRMGKSNRKYSKALEVAMRPYRRQLELGTISNEIAEKLMLDVFVDVILKGWENIYDENGVEIIFSKQNAITLMTALPDVYERLEEEAKIASNFRDEALEKEVKN